MSLVSTKYQPILDTLDRVPRTVTELYRNYAGIAERARLTSRQRHQRQWFFNALMNMVHDRVVMHGEIDGVHHFWRP